MKTRTDLTLNGITFSDLDEKLILQAIEEPTPNWNITATSTGVLHGQRVATREKRYRDITIRFAVNEIRDMAWREEIIQKVRDWAAPGWLSISYKPGKRIWVEPFSMPAQTGIAKWAENYALTFRAWSMPEWEEEEASSVSASGTSGTVRLSVPASHGGLLRVEAVNNSGAACNVLTIACGEQQMTFAGLGLANGRTFTLDYDESNGYLQRIQIGSTSVLSKRGTDSSDDIVLEEGSNAITFTASASLSWRFYCHGRWAG